jgi:hypothetical protein
MKRPSSGAFSSNLQEAMDGCEARGRARREGQHQLSTQHSPVNDIHELGFCSANRITHMHSQNILNHHFLKDDICRSSPDRAPSTASPRQCPSDDVRKRATAHALRESREGAWVLRRWSYKRCVSDQATKEAYLRQDLIWCQCFETQQDPVHR